ncbi:sigma factor [Lacisediminihabitans sp.]|uniref:sigma factor n=1 Tax=Lacisediminihabitans sp. TaxID=2787631 RepID=UPI002F95F91A
MEEPVSKETLLARIAGGDQDAFSAPYDEISPRVFGLIRRLLVDHSRSEEVTQEVFLEIWRSASRYEPSKGGAGTFDAARSGSTLRVLDGAIVSGDTVGITVEPSGGSKKPTTKPIVASPSA